MNTITGIVLGINAMMLFSALGWIVSGVVVLGVIVLTIRELRK